MLPEEARSLLTAAPPPPVQPKHLPALDPSLATEIMPAPPPTSVLFHPTNSHHKKPPAVLSYLPMVDPGSTYVNGLSLSLSDGGTLTPGGEQDEHRKKKRSRTDKPSSSRQPTRSSARHNTPHTGNSTHSKALEAHKENGPPPSASARPSRQVSPNSGAVDPTIPQEATSHRRSNRRIKLTVSESSLIPPQPSSFPPQPFMADPAPAEPSGELPLSEERSTSISNQDKLLMGVDGLSNVRYKNKNKASEENGLYWDTGSDVQQLSDVCHSCVTTVYSHPSMSHLPVSAADREGGGALVYCDSCPKSFHLLCLDPPIDGHSRKDEIPEGGWYCRECSAEHDFLTTGRMPSPPPQFGTELFAPLLTRLQSLNPSEFQLPEEIRHYYKNVVTGPRGGYIDGRKWKLAKGNKQLLFEDRDLYKTRDRNNRPVLCYRCGGSAVRSAVSGDAQMASLVPPSPEDMQLEPPLSPTTVISSQPVDNTETTNLDLLSTAASSRLTPGPSTQPDHGEMMNGVIPTEVEPALTHQPLKGKVTGKRKREPSPVNQSPDNNSQSGPRTRRRTENGGVHKRNPTYDLSDGGRPILSCDFCPLHWHMDCLDPPMTAIPARERKWMCPNHIEHIFAMKPRTPRHSSEPVDIKRPGHHNSGLITIVSNDPPPPPPPPRKRKHGIKMGRIEDMWVGAKRYRVPEAMVVLDFWRKIRDPSSKLRRSNTGTSMDVDEDSDSSSSPLTELSSSDGEGKKSGLSDKDPISTGLPPPRKSRKSDRSNIKANEEGRRKKSRHSVSTAPARSQPRRSVVTKKLEATGEGEPLRAPGEAASAQEASSPSKPATLNSKGGLTLRIPKPADSPSRQKRGPRASSLASLQLGVEPPGEGSEDLELVGTDPLKPRKARAPRSHRPKGVVAASRTGLRSSRAPPSDAPASETTNGLGNNDMDEEAPSYVVASESSNSGANSPHLDFSELIQE